MSQIFNRKFIEFNGFKYPFSYSQKNIEFALNYKPLDSDLFLVTYPKSGTTWTQQILYLILNEGNPVNENKNFVNNTVLEYKGEDCIRTPIIKTHLPFNLLPYNKSSKYVYVVRNPKDTTVSYYNHMKMLFNCDFHHFFEHFLNGQIPYGDYFEHLMSFWSHRMDENFLFLVYEKMKANPKEAVLQMAKFLGENYVNKLMENNESILNKVLEYSSIEFMRNNLEENQYIVRNGSVGQWKQYFNKEENERIENRFNLYFKGTKLYTIWRTCLEC